MKNTRVPGHGLASEGIPQLVTDACDEPACRYERFHNDEGENRPVTDLRVHDRWAGGHARCSCGAESGHLPSQGARRRWHDAHKAEVTR